MHVCVEWVGGLMGVGVVHGGGTPKCTLTMLPSSSVARMEVSMTLSLKEILVFQMTPISGPTSSPLLSSHGE